MTIDIILNKLKDELTYIAPVQLTFFEAGQLQNSGSKIAINVYEITYEYSGGRPFATASISILYWGKDYIEKVEKIKDTLYNVSFNDEYVVDAKIEKIVFTPVFQGGVLVGIKFIIKYYENTIRRI